jgi:hypothetical protein
LLVPVAENDADRPAPVDIEVVNRRAMRVAVDHAVHAVARERAQHCVGIDVHDLRRGLVHRRDVLLAAFAHAFRQALPLSQAESPERELHQWIADDAPQALIRMIVRTQQVAMHQEHRASI